MKSWLPTSEAFFLENVVTGYNNNTDKYIPLGNFVVSFVVPSFLKTNVLVRNPALLSSIIQIDDHNLVHSL